MLVAAARLGDLKVTLGLLFGEALGDVCRNL